MKIRLLKFMQTQITFSMSCRLEKSQTFSPMEFVYVHNNYYIYLQFLNEYCNGEKSGFLN